ncbi:MAG: hypothetical protein JRG71_11660 [Deltaproteobacteria bacterium]|nr:hypothetical protein [Deltaproteobacteria bacterium]
MNRTKPKTSLNTRRSNNGLGCILALLAIYYLSIGVHLIHPLFHQHDGDHYCYSHSEAEFACHHDDEGPHCPIHLFCQLTDHFHSNTRSYHPLSTLVYSTFVPLLISQCSSTIIANLPARAPPFKQQLRS